jgi:hypothetical protein
MGESRSHEASGPEGAAPAEGEAGPPAGPPASPAEAGLPGEAEGFVSVPAEPAEDA